MTPIDAWHGSARLALDLAGGTARIVERMHANIASTANPLNRLMRALGEAEMNTGRSAYQTLQKVKALLEYGLNAGARELREAQIPSVFQASPGKIQAAVNGLCGNHLHDSQNPLAVTMHLHDGRFRLATEGPALQERVANAGPDLVIMVHGWCMNHQYWQREGSAGLFNALTECPDITPLCLNYNSGRHISQNGQALNRLLDDLVTNWPGPIGNLSLVGHSMGGLVIRSACRYAEQAGASWLKPLGKVIYLGSPHHGAALAKAGHLATFAMRSTQYAEPLAFGQYLSAGAKDLRYGNLLDEDWLHVDQDELVPDQRGSVPLTPHAEHFFLAAVVGEKETTLGSLALGDLLVRLGSATGRHREPLKSLNIDPGHCRVLTGLDHFDLLDHPGAQQQIVDWLSD